jgi:hypothetical protein
MKVNWRSFEQSLVEVVTEAIVATARANPAERFYAGVFWLLYADGVRIGAPVFALNAESTEPRSRWIPSDWRWQWTPLEELLHRVNPLYDSLARLEVDDETFDALNEQHVDMLARVSRRATELVKSNQIGVASSVFSPNFFVGILDETHGADENLAFLKRSVDARLLAASGVLEAEIVAADPPGSRG